MATRPGHLVTHTHGRSHIRPPSPVAELSIILAGASSLAPQLMHPRATCVGHTPTRVPHQPRPYMPRPAASHAYTAATSLVRVDDVCPTCARTHPIRPPRPLVLHASPVCTPCDRLACSCCLSRPCVPHPTTSLARAACQVCTRLSNLAAVLLASSAQLQPRPRVRRRHVPHLSRPSPPRLATLPSRPCGLGGALSYIAYLISHEGRLVIF